MRLLRDVTHLYMLAAGTGFTPMARLIQLALQDIASIRSALYKPEKTQHALFKSPIEKQMLQSLLLVSRWF